LVDRYTAGRKARRFFLLLLGAAQRAIMLATCRLIFGEQPLMAHAPAPTPAELAPLLAHLRAARYPEAESDARELLTRYPGAGFLWKALGVSLWVQGKNSVPAMEQAASRLPDDPEAHGNLGNAYRASGRLSDALACYRRAAAIAPNDAGAHERLGSLLFELGELEAAEASCRRALQLNPEGAELHGNLAMLLVLQGRSAEAEASCQRALALDPRLAGTLVILAELEASKGEQARAEELLRRALSIEPDAPEAWAALGRLRTGSPPDEAWLADARRVLALQLPPRREVPLRYAVGRYFDAAGEFEQAFNNYHRANELTRLLNPRYDRDELTRQIDQLTRTYDLEWLRGTAGRGHSSERPVFIVGMWRSGTTLAEQILASHPQVRGAGEVAFWRAAMARYERGAPLENLASGYLQLLESLSAAAPRVADKMPANFLHLGLIHACLPNARIIHMRRHPLDTCLSIYFQDFAHGHPYAHDLGDIAHYYGEYQRIMDHWRHTLPRGALLEVPYESLVDDPETWSRRMLDFIGLPWDRRCLDFHRTQRTVTTYSKWQVRQPFNRASVERWRNYAVHLGPLLPLAQLP
jgi:tetratricopeptide (TPR) repeat protein